MAEEVATVSEEAEVAEPLEVEEPETPEEEPKASGEEDEASGEEPEEDAEEGDEPERKKDAQSRIQQLANEKRELANKLADLESKVNQTLAKKDEIPAIDEQALNSHLGQMREQIDDLRMEGNHLQADLLERKRNKLIDEYDKWQAQAAEKKTVATHQQEYKKALDGVLVAAEQYQTHYNIPQPVWDEMGNWFKDECSKNPLLGREFDDIMIRQGPVAAVRFAHERAKPVFEAKAKEAAETKKQREAGKNKQPGGGSAKEGGGVKSYQALLNLGSAQLAAFKKTNPKRYQQLLDAHIK